MASVLGGEYCIESLRRDVKDLQNTLSDVHSRVGKVKYQSWKFPDKASCDVNISEILDRCQYNQEDEEECQMSHVTLYDIIIDRLVYLLQSFIDYNEILLDVGAGSPVISPKKSNAVRSMSIGLTVKKCWGRMSQIASLLQKLAKEVNARPTAILNTDVRSSPEKATFEQKEEMKVKPLKNKDVSCDVRSVSCQTSETAYTTCETCSRVQSCLNNVGTAIIEVCKTQSLPTALEDFQIRFKDDVPMSIADVMRWSKHQSKDLSRISRHMTNLIQQVTPLKADLLKAQNGEKTLRAELSQVQTVYERKEAELKEEFRRREYRLKEEEKVLKRKIESLEMIQNDTKEQLETCKWKISDLKDELLQKHRDVLNLENSVSHHKEEAIEGQQYKKDAVKFKSEFSRLKIDLEEMEEKLHRQQEQFERERTRNENMSHHEELLQEKQKNLLKRMQVLDEECEKMREHVLMLEEERDNALTQLDEMEKNGKNLEASTKQEEDLENVQEQEICILKQNMESLRRDNKNLQVAIADHQERERLLVAYPDLNHGSEPSPMVQGSGDVLTDMRKQVEANNIRIDILARENDTLQKTLEKLHDSDHEALFHTNQPNDVKHENVIKPIQLWKENHEFSPDHDSSRTSPETIWSAKFRSPDQSRNELLISRPPSGRQHISTIAPNTTHKDRVVPTFQGVRTVSETNSYSSSSLEAYKKMKQQQKSSTSNLRSSFTVGSGKRPKSGRPSSAKSALYKPWT